MGSKSSTRSKFTSPTSSTPPLVGSNSVADLDLKLYMEACKVDPDVRVFDSKLQQHTSSVINTLSSASNDGLEVRSLSFDALTLVTGGLMDMNQEAVRVILSYKEDIWKNKELLTLVEDYFECSVQTLEFFNSLDQCLKRARDRQFTIQVALRRFQEELEMVVNEACDNACDKFAKTLQELRSFKEAGDPFGEEFLSLFDSVYDQQKQMLGRLQLRKHKLDKRLKSVKIYRKVSNIIFVATLVAVVICSVVAAAIAAPPVASALAAGASAPIAGVGKWFDSLWKKYENELKNQRDLIGVLQLGTYVTVRDLDNIRVLVDKLVIKVEELLSNANFALKDTEMLTIVIDEIKKNLNVFMEGIDNLTAHSDKYSREIRQARTVVLHRIIRYPSAPT